MSDFRARGISDPFGYFRSTNRGLAMALVENPHIAKIVRVLLDGIHQWSAERGIPMDRVVFENGLNLKENMILIRVGEGRPVEAAPGPARAFRPLTVADAGRLGIRPRAAAGARR